MRDGVFTDRVIVRCRSAAAQSEVVTGTSERWAKLASEWRVEAVTPTFDPAPKNVALATELGMDRFLTIRVPAGTRVQELASELADQPELFDHVELDPCGEAHTPPVNDPLFVDQWHLRNTGQVISGVPGTPSADIKAVEAWQIVPPLSPVVVAIIDTGVSQSHPDFAGVLVPGRSFIGTDPNQIDDNTNISHGTYCAGIAGASWNNASGGTGLGPNVRIMPIKALSSIQVGSQSTCANGLTWAVDNGARIASMSIGWGSSSESGPLATAVAYAANNNVLLISSVGNSPGSPVGFPARWDKVIAVGGSGRDDEGWLGSTTGIEVDIVAPADNILTTCDDNAGGFNGYSRQSGTSMSAPMVAGVAALVLGVNPSISAQQVRSILLGTSDDLGAPGVDPIFGFGRLNAEQAVLAAIATLPCGADMNRDGQLTIDDIFVFLNLWFTQFPTADFDRDGQLNAVDIFDFLSAWFNGC